MQPDPVRTFLQEADELLAEIEAIVLASDAGAFDAESINRLFRAFHTIKGSGAMFGFTSVAEFTHHLETLLDQARSGTLADSIGLRPLVLAAADHIKLLLQAAGGGPPISPAAGQSVLAMLAKVSGGSPLPGPAAAAEKKLWQIRFRPDPNLLVNGGNPVALLRDLRELGECSVEAHSDGIPPLEEIQPETCYLRWSIELRTAADANAIRDVFLFVEDGSDLKIETSESAPEASPESRPDAPQPSVGRPGDGGAQKESSKESTIRVPVARLDRLVSLVGELVMNHSRMAVAAAGIDAPELASPVEEIERLVGELRDDVLGIRMMPIGTIFGRFRRLVHDLAAEMGKEIELIMEGAETELDKSVLDQLGEPLVHLLRNSIDHGIEPAAERVAQGKPGRGTIRLVAAHRASDVVVSIDDDGRGFDRERIRAKAVEKQVIAADANLSDKEILNLVLLPGFSTASEVTKVSGRGVGMDVVKRQIDALRGTLSLAGDKGQGARVSLTLPLTLAIIEGLLVECGRDQFVIPMNAVMENVELAQAERSRKNGRNVIAVRGELIPYIDVRETFAIGGAGPAISKIVIVHFEEERVGLVVDRVLGTHQTVIQSLGKFFRRIAVVSGSTVMGDGRVALILDIPGVVRFADQRSRTGVAPQLGAAANPVAA